MWTLHLILSEERDRLWAVFWVVTPCCLVVDVNISEECAAFISESQDAVGHTGWVQWRADEMFLKPVQTENITIYLFGVGSVSSVHFTDLISYLFCSLSIWLCSCQNWGWRQHMPPHCHYSSVRHRVTSQKIRTWRIGTVKSWNHLK